MAAKQEQARNQSEAVASYFRPRFTNASNSMVPSLGERGRPTKKLAEGSEEARKGLLTTDRNSTPAQLGGPGRGCGTGPRNGPCDTGKKPKGAGGDLRNREEARCEMRSPSEKIQKEDGHMWRNGTSLRVKTVSDIFAAPEKH